MMGEKIGSKNQLTELLADGLDACICAGYYSAIDLTAQTVVQMFDSVYSEPDVNRCLDERRIVAFYSLSSREGYRIMEKLSWSRPDGQPRRFQEVLSIRTSPPICMTAETFQRSIPAATWSRGRLTRRTPATDAANRCFE